MKFHQPITLLLAVIAAPSFLSAAPEPAKKQPNIVLIMADDLGYNDLGCYGHPQIKTPVLDQLAKSGVRLTNFYSGSTVCTPSRMALLTGAYPTRLGWTEGVVGYLIDPKKGLSPKALTIAEIFKSQDYATGLIGKWHLGDREPFRPHRQGFDYTYYINKSNNQSKTIWRGDEVVEKPFENRLLSEKFTNEAIGFIQRNKAKPFFLYLPFTAPHFPVQAHPDWKGKSAFGAADDGKKPHDYGAVVEELDHRIGQILASLKEQKIDQNTIVIFLSDNGPQGGQKAQSTPYRGTKWSALEGGNRVPCIISWPGTIPAGQENDALTAAIDLLPSLCHACDIDLPSITKDSPVIDGLNVFDSITGAKNLNHPRKDLLIWHGKEGFHSIRMGNWKLFLNAADAKIPGAPQSGTALFKLSKDAAELHNLSSQFPEKVQEMQTLAKRRLADIHQNIIPLGE